MHGSGSLRRWRLSATLLALYVGLVLLPVALAAVQGLEARPWRDELATGLGLAGFTMLLMEFLLSGRFKRLSAQVGQDRVMQFHQVMAYVLVGFLLLHPFLYSLPMGDTPPTVPPGEEWLRLPLWPGLTGMFAWVLLAMLVFMAIARDELPMRYEAWRISHGLGALLIALFGLHHTLEAGRYSQDVWLTGFWVLAVLVAVASLIHVHVIIPLRQRRYPLRVATVRQEAERTWTVELEPDTEAGHPGSPFPYRAGQFAWLKLERPLFRITEHPFSIASAPAQWPRIAFAIKEAGDFTNGIGELAQGTRAYLDGPYGHFTLDENDARPLVLVGGGIGMAPIMALLRELRARQSHRTLVVVQTNRSTAQQLYTAELEDLTRELDLRVHYMLSDPPEDWNGLIGLPDATLVQQVVRLPLQDCVYYLCGPPAMIDTLEHGLLSRLRIPAGQVVSERFRYTLGTRRGSSTRLLTAAIGSALVILAGVAWFAVR